MLHSSRGGAGIDEAMLKTAFQNRGGDKTYKITLQKMGIELLCGADDIMFVYTSKQFDKASSRTMAAGRFTTGEDGTAPEVRAKGTKIEPRRSVRHIKYTIDPTIKQQLIDHLTKGSTGQRKEARVNEQGKRNAEDDPPPPPAPPQPQPSTNPAVATNATASNSNRPVRVTIKVTRPSITTPLGLVLVDRVVNGRSYVVINEIRSGSLLDRCGLNKEKLGTVLKSLNGVPCASVQAVADQIKTLVGDITITALRFTRQAPADITPASVPRQASAKRHCGMTETERNEVIDSTRMALAVALSRQKKAEEEAAAAQAKLDKLLNNQMEEEEDGNEKEEEDAKPSAAKFRNSLPDGSTLMQYNLDGKAGIREFTRIRHLPAKTSSMD